MSKSVSNEHDIERGMIREYAHATLKDTLRFFCDQFSFYKLSAKGRIADSKDNTYELIHNIPGIGKVTMTWTNSDGWGEHLSVNGVHYHSESLDSLLAPKSYQEAKEYDKTGQWKKGVSDDTVPA